MRTLGVEEELLLVGAADSFPAALGDSVVAAAESLAPPGEQNGPQIEHEFKQEQAETATMPCTTLDQLRAELVELRANMAEAARARGGLAVAIATSPVKTRPHLTPDERYEQMNREFGLLARQQLTCGQHVHVGVASRDEGVAVLDRIRVWLPVLIAISANSPFWQGADTGYASYRTMLWNQWPSAGPTEHFGTVAEYDRQVAALVASGAALDEGMVYYSARLSARYPTVEIRVADVCTAVDDAVLIAALCRALVETAVADHRAGAEVHPVTTGQLRTAAWRAARHGLTGELFDPRTSKRMDAWQLLDQLVEHVSTALAATGDDRWVADTLRRLRTSGTGAERQRAVARDAGGLTGVISEAAERTLQS